MSTSITSHDVNEISEASFSDGWARVTGYRPAAVLTDRRAMIAMLMEEVAILPVFPQSSSTFPRPTRDGSNRLQIPATSCGGVTSRPASCP